MQFMSRYLCTCAAVLSPIMLFYMKFFQDQDITERRYLVKEMAMKEIHMHKLK